VKATSCKEFRHEVDFREGGREENGQQWGGWVTREQTCMKKQGGTKNKKKMARRFKGLATRRDRRIAESRKHGEKRIKTYR